MRLRELVGQKLFIQMHKDTAVCYHTDESFVGRITKWRQKLEDHPNCFKELLCTEGFVRGISTEQGHILLGKLLEDFGPANIVQLASTNSLMSALMDDAHMEKVNDFVKDFTKQEDKVTLLSTNSLMSALMDDAHMKKVKDFLMDFTNQEDKVRLLSTGSLIHALMDDAHMKKVKDFLKAVRRRELDDVCRAIGLKQLS